MEIPDFLPVLSSGGHPHPSYGACMMEYASVLAGEPFSPAPVSVHRLLRSIAINVNDTTPDSFRNQLAILLPRFIGTGDLSHWNSDALAEPMWHKVAVPLIDGIHAQYPGTGELMRLWRGDMHAQQARDYARVSRYEIAMQFAAMVAGPRGNGYVFLTRCLDVFDAVTGRTEVLEPMTGDQFRELAAKVGTPA